MKFHEEFRGIFNGGMLKAAFISMLSAICFSCMVYMNSITARGEDKVADFSSVPFIGERMEMLSNFEPENKRPIGEDQYIEIIEAIKDIDIPVDNEESLTSEANDYSGEINNINIVEEEPEPIVYNEYFTSDTDLGAGFSGVTAEMIDEATLHYSQYQDFENPFIGKGYIFIEAQEQSGLDALFIYALAVYESGWGTSRLARQRANYFGIGAWDSDLNRASYMGDSLYDGIVNGAIWIAEHYYFNEDFCDGGQTTVGLMNSISGHSYAPGNECWGPNSVHFINHFYENWRK